MDIKRIFFSSLLALIITIIGIQIHHTPIEHCFTDKLPVCAKYQIKAYFFLDKLVRSITPELITNTIMKNNFNAVPCTDKKLIQLFNTIQDELQIYPKIQLFSTATMPKSVGDNGTAFYTFQEKTVTIVDKHFYAQPEIYQRHILYHELRHHVQNITPSYAQFNTHTKHLLDNKNLTYEQALEHDADLFAAIKTTNACPVCTKKFKQYFVKQKPQNYQGYITQEDFCYINQPHKEGYFCNNHNSKAKRMLSTFF